MLEGKNVILRPLTLADAPHTLELRLDTETNLAFLGYVFPINEANERRWIESLYAEGPRRRADFAIVDRRTGDFAGLIAITDLDHLHQRARFGILLRRDARGKGLAPDAMSVLFDYAFHQLNLSRVWLEVLAENERAVNLYKRFGFVHEGTLRSHYFQDGRFKDLLVMGLQRSEFEPSGGGRGR